MPFARVEDAAFWADKERIKVLIDLYEYYECLWKLEGPICSVQKCIQEKAAKVEIRKYLGWLGKWSYLPTLHDLRCRLSVLLEGRHCRPSMTARVSRPY